MAALRKAREDMPVTSAPETMQEREIMQTSPSAVPDALAASKILSALQNSSYDWRTVHGLSRETRIPEPLVVRILEGELAPEIVRSVDRTRPNRYLYTTRERYEKIRGLKSKVLSLVTGQIR